MDILIATAMKDLLVVNFVKRKDETVYLYLQIKRYATDVISRSFRSLCLALGLMNHSSKNLAKIQFEIHSFLRSFRLDEKCNEQSK